MTDDEDVAADAVEALCELEATTDYDVDKLTPAVAWVDGYIEGWLACARQARP